MTAAFNKITDRFYASPQITPDDILRAKSEGFDLVINNRPDGEEVGQPLSEVLRAAAGKAEIEYVEIPIGRDGISPAALDHFDSATQGKQKVLGFCRTGTRSTMLRSFAQARAGAPIDQVLSEAANGGYDLGGHRLVLENLQTGQ